jgi:TonB family protein
MALKMIQCCRIFCITLLNSAAAGAQCPLGPMAELLSRSSSDVVFSGVVANLDRTMVAETVTFNVEWVWKGSVHRRTSIVRPVPISGGRIEPIRFELKSRYVVAAHRLTAGEEHDLRLSSSDDQLGTDACGGGSRLLSAAQNELAQLGPGHAPDGQPAGRTQAFPPVKIKDAAPEVPRGFADVRATVILEITVDASGHVRDPRILRSIANLDQIAIDCVMKCEYAPTLLNGIPTPVKMTVTVPIGAGPGRGPVR